MERLPQKRLHAANNLLGGERLGDVTGGPDLATTEDILGEAASGEHDDGKVLGFCVAAQSRCEVEAVGRCGEGNIEQHEVHLLFAKQLFRGLGGRCFEGGKAFPAKLERQNAPDIRLIVDDQNTAPHVRKSKGVKTSNQGRSQF